MVAHRLVGACACGEAAAEVGLSREPAVYSPRACDCDFCRERGAAWLSDPAGFLRLRTNAGQGFRIERQGSELAEFLSCAACGTLMAVRWQDDGDGRVYAVVNARTLSRHGELAGEQDASPKLLEAAEKTARWKALWFADVGVATDRA
ncbi:MAG TPA: aldehyde-activating protein [Pseudoxanthomonas sp.]|nr:aldehyde-activating protein [Pseudoxanthomonas sp.]